jgi:hypothetical protein
MQGQLDNLALVGLGLSIPLILAILDRAPDAVGAILLMPVLFFGIAFTQLRYERQTILDAIFADSDLRPKIQELVSAVSLGEAKVLEYETFLAQHSWTASRLLDWIATASRAGISLAVAVGLIVVYFYLRSALVGFSLNPYEIWLLVTNCAMLIGDFTIAFFAGRIRHDYLAQRSYY